LLTTVHVSHTSGIMATRNDPVTRTVAREFLIFRLRATGACSPVCMAMLT
jgi:hypothetical protein